MIRSTTIALLMLGSTYEAGAQQLLRHEPRAGGVRAGEIVLVDDGRCPRGQVTKVTGGYSAGGRNGQTGGGGRTRECVARP